MPRGITFKIDDDLHMRLRILLVKKDERLTKLVESLLRTWVNENEQKEKEA